MRAIKYKKDKILTVDLKNTDLDSLDGLFFLDYYNIPDFGRTKMALMLDISKEEQDKKITKELVEMVSEDIIDFINKNSFDAIGFVPFSIKREVQIMNFLKKHINVEKKKIRIEKIVPENRQIKSQKALRKKEERINNAIQTFSVIKEEDTEYKKVLLIDDLCGSGATLNEISRKIKNQGMAKKVFGLTIIGSKSRDSFPVKRSS